MLSKFVSIIAQVPHDLRKEFVLLAQMPEETLLLVRSALEQTSGEI